jgi:hypothetical protein
MNRIAIAFFAAAATATLVLAADLTQQPDQLGSFRSKQLVVTGIAQHSLRYTVQGAVTSFAVQGAPTLHAVMPVKHMTLDAAALTGHLDSAGALKDAVLTGGVTGTLTQKATKGTNKITFTGTTVNYTEKGTVDSPAADIDASERVTFKSANSAVGSKFALNGSHGVFNLKTLSGDRLGLSEANLDGPVSFSFAGVRVVVDKKPQSSSGSGTAGHLTVVRGDGLDYVLHLSGGVSLKGVGGGFDADFPKTEAVTVVLDQDGNFKSLTTDGSVSGTLTPSKKQA